jgi:chlorite dismutase
MINITKGKRTGVLWTWREDSDNLMRVYDKLRKRSYRKHRDSSRYKDVIEHRAYVQGVKDALNELRR